jgi:DNA-binding response OmpR family regulator
LKKMLPKRSNILIIDSDLGSVFWLGQALDSAGCEAVPAKSLSDAKSLVAELKLIVDLLIVRSSMPGAAGFAQELRRSQGHLKTIGLLGDDEEQSDLGLEMDAWLHKPFLTEETAKCDYLDLIQWVLADDSGTRSRLEAPAWILC